MALLFLNTVWNYKKKNGRELIQKRQVKTEPDEPDEPF